MAIDSRKLSNWYDFTAPFYTLWRDDYHDPMLRHVRRILRDVVAPRSILDAACGTGLYTIGLAGNTEPWRIDGIDASAGMLRVARRKLRARGLGDVVLRQGDVSALPYRSEAFDAVVASGLMPNLEPPLRERALREFCRVLRPGGHLMLVEIDRTAMTARTRLFFHAMILGYRLVSTVVRRFRFSDDWGIRHSTIDPTLLDGELRRAGFTAVETDRRAQQVLLHRVKGPAG